MPADYLQSIARSIARIESNLTQPLSLETIAAPVANYSPYHFLRLFRAATGETPGSYLRKRRLSEAARAIIESERPLITIAFDYQFQSQEAFSRSFKQQFGIPPGALRRTRPFLHLTPPATIDLTPSPSSALPPQILSLPELLLAGIAYHGDSQDGALSGTWAAFSRLSIPHQLQPPQHFGLWSYPGTFRLNRDFDYLAGTAVTAAPPELVSQRLPAATYAAFEHHGSIATIRCTYTYAYGEWLPHSGYQLAGQYDLEAYDARFTGPDQDDSVLRILIPITSQ